MIEINNNIFYFLQTNDKIVFVQKVNPAKFIIVKYVLQIFGEADLVIFSNENFVKIRLYSNEDVLEDVVFDDFNSTEENMKNLVENIKFMKKLLEMKKE